MASVGLELSFNLKHLILEQQSWTSIYCQTKGWLFSLGAFINDVIHQGMWVFSVFAMTGDKEYWVLVWQEKGKDF